MQRRAAAVCAPINPLRSFPEPEIERRARIGAGERDPRRYSPATRAALLQTCMLMDGFYV